MRAYLIGGIVLAIIGIIVAVVASLTYTIVICPPPATTCPNAVSFEANTGTYMGLMVIIGGLVLAGISLTRRQKPTVQP
jgi:hypothetical protein